MYNDTLGTEVLQRILEYCQCVTLDDKDLQLYKTNGEIIDNKCDRFHAINYAKFVYNNHYWSFTGNKIRDKLELASLKQVATSLLRANLWYYTKYYEENSASNELFNAAWNILLTYTKHYNMTELHDKLEKLVKDVLVFVGVQIRKDMHDIFVDVIRK